MLETYFEEKAGHLEGAFRELARNAIAEMPIPSLAPSAGELLLDPTGRLWIQETSVSRKKPRRWRVFTRTGELTAIVEVQAGTEFMSVGRRHILAVRLNDDDEEMLELYPIPHPLLPK